MSDVLMPRATAVWLLDNTTLTFAQIAKFCGLHHLEVKGIADGDVAENMRGVDPIAGGILSREEIALGEADATYDLKVEQSRIDHIPQPKRKGSPSAATSVRMPMRSPKPCLQSPTVAHRTPNMGRSRAPTANSVAPPARTSRAPSRASAESSRSTLNPFKKGSDPFFEVGCFILRTSGLETSRSLRTTMC